MDKYQTINFNDIEYYYALDILDFSPTFFYGTNNNVRNIVKKKRIPNDDHLYAYKKAGKWILSNKKYCRSKLFISKEWVYDNVPKAFNRSQVIADIEPLPPKVILDDDQKFCDDEYEYNITMRGERDPFKCYFKVDDIAEIFGLKNIKRIITDKTTSYKKDHHYKLFINAKNKKKKCKDLYFTYVGFIKFIFSSTNINFKIEKNCEKLLLWANSIVYPQVIHNNIIIKKVDLDKIDEGIFYLVKTPLLNAVKIGYWKAPIKSLVSRYTTPYGSGIEIYYVNHVNVVHLEKLFKKKFKNFKITNELYQKNNMEKYFEYMSTINKIEKI